MTKILLIEDNQDVRENTAEILELSSYEVYTAEDGKKGLEVAMRTQPDIIICDIMMPKINGYDVLLHLSKDKTTASIPFIFLSAKTERIDVRKGMNLGADDYLTKPYEENELLDAIASRLKKHSFLKKEFSKDIEGINQFFNEVSLHEGMESLSADRVVVTFNKKDFVFMEGDADLIIMGSNGLTMQDGIFAGSNAEKMVRNSITPVLIIKSEPKNFGLKNVVMATDLNPENTLVFLQKSALFLKLGSIIHLVYVNLPYNNFISSREFNEKVKLFVKAGGSDKVEFIAGYSVEDGLTQNAEKINANLIAISTHARKGLNHFMKGSISEDLANHAKLPVMTFKLQAIQ